MFSHFLRKLGLLGSANAEGSRTFRLGGRKWRLAPNASTVFGPNGPDLDQWLADGSAQIVKTGTHRTVYRVVLPGGTIYVKHCRISGSRAWVREVLRPPKARLEFENLAHILQGPDKLNAAAEHMRQPDLPGLARMLVTLFPTRIDAI